MKPAIYNNGKIGTSEPDFKLVEPAEKYEVSGESKRGKMLETYFRPADAYTRGKEMLKELTQSLEADACEVGSITIRKVKHGD